MATLELTARRVAREILAAPTGTSLEYGDVTVEVSEPSKRGTPGRWVRVWSGAWTVYSVLRADAPYGGQYTACGAGAVEYCCSWYLLTRALLREIVALCAEDAELDEPATTENDVESPESISTADVAEIVEDVAGDLPAGQDEDDEEDDEDEDE